MRWVPIALVLAAAPAAAQFPDSALLARAHGVHDRVTTIDTHVDMSASNFVAGRTNFVSGLPTKVDLPKMEKGGLDAVFFSIYQDQRDDFTAEGYRRAYDLAVAKIEAVWRPTSDLAPDRIGLARTAADVRRLQREGNKVALMGMENGYAIGEDITNLRKFADMGVRYLSLAHSDHSQLADSHSGKRRWNGLSPLGQQVVAEANRVGILLDLSHPSKQANRKTIELSRAPVIASHSAVRALASHSRNLDDDELLAIGKNGGVVQIVAYGAYLVRGTRRATVTDLVNHVDYAVKLIGIDHVGIASDFDGGGGIVGWNDASETFNVTLELVRRGYPEEDIARLWGGKLLRVMAEAERIAAELRTER